MYCHLKNVWLDMKINHLKILNIGNKFQQKKELLFYTSLRCKTNPG